MTIEERAADFSAKWLEQEKEQVSYDGYVAGATEQKAIDERMFREIVGNACNCLNLMEYLDAHRPDDKMCFSNSECADLDTAWHSGDWAKVIRYIHKYEEQKAIDDEKYKRLRQLAYDMYNHAVYLTDDARPLRKSMEEFHHYICFEEEKYD